MNNSLRAQRKCNIGGHVAYRGSVSSGKESPRDYWVMGKLHIKNECHKSRDCIKLLSKKGTDSVAHRGAVRSGKGYPHI